MLVKLFSLKTIESLKSRLQPHPGVTQLFSIKTILSASLQSCHSIDSDAQRKRAVKSAERASSEVVV